MDDQPGWISTPEDTPASAPAPSVGNRKRGLIAGATLLAAGGLAGAILTGTLSAGAATPSPSPSASSGSSSTGTGDTDGDGPHGGGSFPEHGTAAHESLEKPVTGASATKAQAAAVKSVGGGTAGVVTTDMTGDGYEVTVTRADGSTVEVHLDSSFAVETHGGPGGHGGDHDGDGPQAAPSASASANA